MTVARSEIDSMAKFMAAIRPDALAGPAAPEPTGIAPPVSPATPPLAQGGVPAAAVDEMRRVLERMQQATDNVVAEAPYDRALREALVTDTTEIGARIGAWEIRPVQEGKHSVYDVVNLISGEPLASGLLLYEAAHGLARILNDGGRINSPEALELLQAEQEYNSRVHDMVLYRHRLVRNPKSPRFAVFEARYSDAKRRATQARARVVQLSERRV